MAKYLRCHTSGKYVTKGKQYEIISEQKREYKIRDDNEHEHSFTEEKYRNWFTLVTDENITLLPDESLGGIEREYNEVKRKANVGELVKSCVDNPPVFKVTEEGYGSVSGGADGIPTCIENYVVLEPSDIIRINGERLRMVDRNAVVGERVVIMKSTYGSGFVAECTCTHEFDDGSISIQFVKDGRLGFLDCEYEKYAVLEPLTNAIPTQTTRNKIQLSTLDPVDQYVANVATLTSNIAALTTKVQALEKRVATLESAKQDVKVASGNVSNTKPSFIKTAQQIRDEIVERAKADVKRLVAETGSGDGFLSGRFPSIRRMGHVRFEFVVNRDKRTVTALGYLMYASGNPPKVVGRAKAAPGEVFNVHIGKVIALHRALGIDVPAEYMNVPAPTEIRVGDIVNGTDTREYGYYSVNKAFTITEVRENGTYKYAEDAGDWLGPDDVGVITDDSRDSEVNA